MTEQEALENYYLGGPNSLDRRDGVRVEMTKVPRLQREPIHPPRPAEPVTPSTRKEEKLLFRAATGVLLAVLITLGWTVASLMNRGAL